MHVLIIGATCDCLTLMHWQFEIHHTDILAATRCYSKETCRQGEFTYQMMNWIARDCDSPFINAIWNTFNHAH